MTSVLFVCLGNICRSPLAEGILRAKLVSMGADGRIGVDSAGTGSWHVGKAPDPRSIAIARRNGIDLTRLRARQVTAADFQRFDLVLAMDGDNLANLKPMRVNGGGVLRRFLDVDVPDPYFGGPDGFQRVFEMLDAGCDRLLPEVTQGV
ncbi:low molecular weight protein-tyrosine-phosphatase [Stappia stellulata]|uniref:low molecular weight protein-tyrosine-phosphatase n=1 Tax=Stappia stellulata TaxID=71235 RepID=UPI0003FF8735|nr:low molecular weight protein-tyrosine-phosphatase [Stappia stellulata]